MKAMIILINIILAGVLSTATVSALKSKPVPSAPVRRAAVKKKTPSQRKSEVRAEEPPEAKLSLEEQTAEILKADLFNPERTPNAANGRRNARGELTLVGTFEAGKIKGAVIVVRTNTRQVNPFMRMMFGGPGGPGGQGGPGGMGFNNARRPGGGPGVQRFSFGQNNMNNRRGGNNEAVKQYVRLGETMSNGYTLVAITRDRATLTRGGDKLELDLQAPSINQNASRRGGGPKLNINQQLQQAQLLTQQMMVRTLMDMRAGGNRAPGGGGGGGNRGGNRGGGRGR